MKNRNIKYKILVFFLITILLFLLDLFVGAAEVPISSIIHLLKNGTDNTVESIILFDFRLPKAISAIIVGAGLSVSGILMQSLFRNPLAGPYVLGVSSGASLMVAIIIMISGAGFFSLVASSWVIAISSFIGAFGVLLLVLVVATRVQDSVSLLIIGIMIAGLASSLVSLMQYFTTPELLQQFIVWTFGSLSSVNYEQLMILAPVVLIGVILSLVIQKKLNTLLLGDNYAQLLGVSMKKLRFTIIILTGFLAGSITAFAGPIVFVGVAVPHLARSILKTNDHGLLIPGSVFMGASLLLICDVIAQIPSANSALPINAVTSLIGAPIIIWIIIKNKRLRTINF